MQRPVKCPVQACETDRVFITAVIPLEFGLTSFEGIFGLYAIKLYGYGPERVGTIIVMIGVISATMQSALTGPLSRRWGEAYIIKVSLVVCAIGFVFMLRTRVIL